MLNYIFTYLAEVRAKSIEKELIVKIKNFLIQVLPLPLSLFDMLYMEVEADNISFRTKCFLSHYHLQNKLNLLTLTKQFLRIGCVCSEYCNTQPLIASLWIKIYFELTGVVVVVVFIFFLLTELNKSAYSKHHIHFFCLLGGFLDWVRPGSQEIKMTFAVWFVFI